MPDFMPLLQVLGLIALVGVIVSFGTQIVQAIFGVGDAVNCVAREIEDSNRKQDRQWNANNQSTPTGDVYDLNRVQNEFGRNSKLLQNMLDHGWNHVVKDGKGKFRIPLLSDNIQ